MKVPPEIKRGRTSLSLKRRLIYKIEKGFDDIETFIDNIVYDKEFQKNIYVLFDNKNEYNIFISILKQFLNLYENLFSKCRSFKNEDERLNCFGRTIFEMVNKEIEIETILKKILNKNKNFT